MMPVTSASKGADDPITLRSRVRAREAGSALLDFLAGRFRYHSRNEWVTRIADGRVTIDGERAKPEHILAAGEIVSYLRTEREPDAPTDVRVVFDRNGIVVVDKPAGLPFHADGAFLTRTVVGVLERELGVRLRPVQRLDRETSGLCVLARDRATARALHEELAARDFEKTYDALVRGVPEFRHTVVDAAIGRGANSEITIRRAVVNAGSPNAEPALSAFDVVATGSRSAWVRCRPRTGRTHQIRVHLESLGLPLIGDKLYGRTDADYLAWLAHVKAGGDASWGSRLGAGRQMLHARELAFTDPRSGERLSFHVEPPADFLACAREEGLHSGLGDTTMNRLPFVAALALGAVAPAQTDPQIHAVPARHVLIDDVFWAPRIRVSREQTIPHALDRCADRIRNLQRAAHLLDGEFEGPYPYDDSDLFKVIEGVANHLALAPDETLRFQLDALTTAIAAAQEDDGYLYTARQLGCERLRSWFGDTRWSNLRRSHELYNLGHLIEAGVAAFEATGDRRLLDVAIRAADRIDADFGPSARHDPPGHPEVELALCRLARVTGEDRYLALARFFLDVRGHCEDREGYGPYAQDHEPLTAQREAVGHAVRAAYLYAAMADVAADQVDAELGAAVERLWQDVVSGRLYVIGGIGSRSSGEAFGEPFELPNDTAYCETCAAIALANWSHRMFLRSGDAGAIDVLERAVFNNVLSGVGLDGQSYFYPNPLATKDGTQRNDWFDCACCPSNLARFVPAIGRFVCATRGSDTVWVNLYVDGAVQVPLGDGEAILSVKTRYPWDGSVELRVDLPAPRRFALRLRIPGWAREAPVPSDLYAFADAAAPSPDLWLDGEPVALEVDRGYAVIERDWHGGETLELVLPMPVRRLHAHSAVEADRGRVALQRGPLVYCVEGLDVDDPARLATSLVVAPDATLAAADELTLLDGCVTVHGEGQVVRRAEDGKIETGAPVAFRAIPYALRANRAPTSMVVWLAEIPDVADSAGVTEHR